MASAGLDTAVREHARLVNEAIEAFLPRGDRRTFAVVEPMRHVVSAGGKRIRPILCLLAHEAAGGDAEDALPTAVGIELLHSFTLVHDDIMDKALERRRRPTVGALWGDDVAITVGDALFALAFDAFGSNADVAGIEKERVLSVVRAATRVCLDLAHGQTLDLLHARRSDVTVAEHLEMTRLKTGVLLEFSLASGAMLAGAGAADVRALSRFGAPLGVAFQIRDDLLDLVGDATRLGKPTGGDIRMGKRTLMVAHALEHSPRAPRLAEILDTPSHTTTPEMVREACSILEGAGSLSFARDRAEAYLAEAKRELQRIPGRSTQLQALGGIADYVLQRTE